MIILCVLTTVKPKKIGCSANTVKAANSVHVTNAKKENSNKNVTSATILEEVRITTWKSADRVMDLDFLPVPDVMALVNSVVIVENTYVNVLFAQFYNFDFVK